MSELSELTGTRWAGTAELWLDPLGNDGVSSPCTMRIEPGVVRYTWAHEGEAQEGSIALRDDGAAFSDSWHQASAPMECRYVQGALGLFWVEGAYGPESAWRWRIGLCLRAPTGELVLQMTNIAPWGEEARAVRMVCQRV